MSKNIRTSKIKFNLDNCPPELYYLLSIALSFLLFFHNEALSTFLTHDGYNYYADLSKNIFHPNYILKGVYFSESMLLPLIGKLTGAYVTPLTYRILCSSIILFTLPTLSYFAIKYFGSLSKSIFFIIILAGTFTAFRHYTIGAPDPLTILLLGCAALSISRKSIFIFILLAALSHFAVALLSSILLTFLFATQNNGFPESKSNGYSMAKCVILALISGRILLSAWYFIFDYSPQGRFLWAYEHGINSFIQSYHQNQIIFWLTPGPLFLICYFVVLFFLLIKKKWLMVTAGAISLFAAYTAMFFTLDSLRIFACVIAGPFIFLLSRSIELIGNKTCNP